MKPVDLLGFGPKRVETPQPDGTWIVTVIPPAFAHAGPGTCVSLTADQYARYLLWRERSILIQDALPELSNADREILMTGIGPEMFDAMYQEEDE